MATQTLTAPAPAPSRGTTATATMFAAAAPPAPPPPPARVKRYKDFLTPALHRRFCSAAGWTLVLCLADSFWLSTARHVLWSWFPLGPAGVRALLLFLPCLMVFIVRLANMHVGPRTSSSPAQTLYAKVGTAQGLAGTLNTIFWYWASAVVFGEVYIWSSAQTPEMVMVDVGAAYERPRLNENPIALRCLFASLAVTQAFLHMWRDYDQLHMGSRTGQHENDVAKLQALLGDYAKRVPGSVQELLARARTILARSINLMVVGVAIFPATVYFGLLRRPAWRMTYSFASIFYRDLPSNENPTGLQHPFALLGTAIVSSFMLVALWEVCNATFDIFTSQPPLRKGEPLTSEIQDARGVVLHRSKDPNGSLLTGLKSNKEVNKSFALWELFLITTQFEKRRRTIYTEVDRTTGSTWSQVCKICLDEVEAVKRRIATANEPVDYRKQQEEANLRNAQPPMMPQPQDDHVMQKIADRQVISDGVVEARQRPDFYNTVGNLARSVGQHPGAQNPILPRAQKAIEWSRDQVPQEYQNRFRPQVIEQQANGKLVQLLKSPLGQPFRQTFARQVKATIFGSPTSHKIDVLHAVKSLSQLSVLSLKEDDYGQAQKDIPTIMRTLTSVIVAVENYVQSLQPHWTDVDFMETRDRNVAEVDELIDLLKSSLEEILLAFGEYADTLGLSMKEVREAREASTKTPKEPVPQIEQTRRPDASRPVDQGGIERQRRERQRPRPEMRERRRQ